MRWDKRSPHGTLLNEPAQFEFQIENFNMKFFLKKTFPIQNLIQTNSYKNSSSALEHLTKNFLAITYAC